MSTPFSVTINGSASAYMRGLNLAFSGLELVNMATDSASLRWVRKRASECCPIAHNDTVEIWQAGVRLFRGRARLGAVTHEGVPIKLLGPWSHLEEQIFQLSLEVANLGEPDGLILGDTYVVAYPPYSLNVAQSSTHNVTFTVTTRSGYAGWPATTAESDVNMGWASRCWLFRPSGTSGQVYTTIQDEWTRLMLYISTVNPTALFDVGDVAFGSLLAPRVRTVSDITTAEALKQILAMKPDAAVWWDYSGDALAEMRAGVASLETALELTIGSSNGTVLTGYQLRVADELVPAGVVVRWERDVSTSTGLGSPYLADFYPGSEVLTTCSVSTGSAGVSCDSTASLEVGMIVTGTYVPTGTTVTAIGSGTTFTMSKVATGTLASQRMIARAADGAASYQPGVLLHTVTDEMAFVPGIAKDVYQSLAVRRAQGTLTVLDRQFQLGLRPGRVINLTGDAQLTGIQLWVQAVSWSPDTGLAQLTVGYPQHLQLKDRVDLRGWLKASFSTPFQSFSWTVPPP